MSAINVRQTARLFWKDPAFFVTVMLIMAMSIGATTAVFSLVKGVLWTDLPYHDPSRLAIIWHGNGNSTDVIGVWPRDYMTYRDTLRAFQNVTAFSNQGYNLSSGSEPSRITCTRVTSKVLPMLGVMPIRGRWLTDEDDRAGAEPSIVLSHDLWRARFGEDAAILGKTIRLDLHPYTVIGVMPDSFAFPPEGLQLSSKADCWIAADFTPAEMLMPSFKWIVLGNLNPGVSFQQAQEDASVVARHILESYPAAVQKEVALRARVIPLQEEVRGRSRMPLLVFSASVGFLLLIGCANVANLILAKLHVRQREIAVRAALGATGASLALQLLAESVFLALCGGLLGIPLSFALLRVFAIFSSAKIPANQIHIDVVALVFSIACSVMSGMLTGLAPAFRARRVDVAMAMAERSRASSGGVRQNRLRSALAISEIALALVLLIGAGLLLRSFVKLANVSPGFDPSNVLTFAVALPEQDYKQPGQVKRFVDTVLEGMHSFNGVTFASAATSLPMGETEATVFSRIGAPPAAAGFKAAGIQIVSHEYLRTFGIHLIRGRPFDAGDDNSRIAVALVNEAMAQKYWPDTEVLGKQFYWLVGRLSLTVVGVVADVRQEGLSAPPMPTFYVPLAQSPQADRNLVFAMRTAQATPGLHLAVRRIVKQADDALPVFSLRSASELVSNSIATERFDMFVVAAFATLALTLSVAGLYSVISYLVVHTRSELGLRMALGATPGRILRMVLISGCRFVSAGILVGTVLALILTRFMRSMLFGVMETDHATFALVIVLLAGVSMLAALVPAIRATKVDPAVSLRL